MNILLHDQTHLHQILHTTITILHSLPYYYIQPPIPPKPHRRTAIIPPPSSSASYHQSPPISQGVIYTQPSSFLIKPIKKNPTLSKKQWGVRRVAVKVRTSLEVLNRKQAHHIYTTTKTKHSFFQCWWKVEKEKIYGAGSCKGPRCLWKYWIGNSYRFGLMTLILFF